MIITKMKRDLIKVCECDINEPSYDLRIHLIKLDFESPDADKMQWVTSEYPQTRRFIIDRTHLKFYNSYFKGTNLKYYIINTYKDSEKIISFYRKNNKVLLDFTILDKKLRTVLMDYMIDDILYNTEVVLVYEDDIEKYKSSFKRWRGNCIIHDPDYII